MADTATTSTIVAWALGAAGATGIAVAAAFKAIWKSKEDTNSAYIRSLERQALANETRAISAEQARAVAEKRAGELEIRAAYFKQQFQLTTKALNNARVRVDPGAMVGSVPPPPDEGEPTGVWHAEAGQLVNYFTDPSVPSREREREREQREEAERRRQRDLNPSRTAHDASLAEYIESMKRGR